MSYKVIKGDLLDLFDKKEFSIIVHGCNCFHLMGAGIAGQIAKRYPQAMLSDITETNYGDMKKLSNWTAAPTETGMVINLYTQFEPGANFDMDAFKLGLKKLRNKLSKHPNVKVGFPMIGSGIGGGDWTKIEFQIANILGDFDITVVEYKPKKEKE